MPDARLYEPASLGPWSNRGETLHASLTAQLKNVEARGEGNQRFQQHPLTQIAPLLRQHCEDIEKFKKALNEIPITGYLSKEELRALKGDPTATTLLKLLRVKTSIHEWLLKRITSQKTPCVSVYIECGSVPKALRKLHGVEWHPAPSASRPWMEIAIGVAALVLVAVTTGWPALPIARDPMPPQAVASEPITPEPVAPPPAPAPLNESPVAPAALSRVAVDPPKREPNERKRPMSGGDTARATPVGLQQPSQVQPEEVAPSESQKQESQRDEATPDVTNPSASTSSTAGPLATRDAPPAPALNGPVTLRVKLTVWSSETDIALSCGALRWVCLDGVRFAADGPVVEGHIFIGTVQPVITLNGISIPFDHDDGLIVGSSRETLRPLNLVEVRSGDYSDKTKEFAPLK